MSSTRLKHLQTKLRFFEHTSLLLLAAFIGICASLGAGLIRFVPKWWHTFYVSFLSGLHVPTIWSTFLLAMLAFALNAYVLRKWIAPQGIAEVMITGYVNPKYISFLGIVLNTLGSLINLGFGLPVGSVGPTVYFGAGVASRLSSFFIKNKVKNRILLSCGAAGGIAALFNAPIGGMLFAIEIILHKYSTEHFSMVIISSFAASILSRWMFGDHPVIQVPTYTFHASEIPFFIVLGVLCGLYALVHIKALYDFEQLWKKLRTPSPVPMLISAAAAWGTSLFFPIVLFGGYQGIEQALFGKMSLLTMVSVLLFYLVVHSMVISSGYFGGIFGPVLFTGSMLGGAYGIVIQHFAPSMVSQAELYALLGIAGVIASTCRAPLTAMVLLFEMTNDYRMILPLMLTSVIAFSIHHDLEDRSLFTARLFKNGQYRRSIPLR